MADLADVSTMVDDFSRLQQEYEILALRHFTLGVETSSLTLNDLLVWAVITRVFVKFTLGRG